MMCGKELTYVYTLPILPYEYHALEPYISSDIMTLHHTKHHQTYIDKLNAALQGAPEAVRAMPLDELLRDLAQVPESIRQAVRNHGGGHYNHSLFWRCLAPANTTQMSSELLAALVQKYGSLDAFKAAFTEQALAVFGSGWAWLMPDLSIVTTPNQDTPLMQGLPEPILGIDVWEHAYYLDYKSARPEYIAAWWSVINWDTVSDRYRLLAVEAAAEVQ